MRPPRATHGGTGSIIELEEQVRMTSNVINCKPEELYVGMPVEVIFGDVSEEVALPEFRPVRD